MIKLMRQINGKIEVLNVVKIFKSYALLRKHLFHIKKIYKL